MSVYFLDTSAVAKRYIFETGSRWVRGITRPTSGNIIIISMLATVEVISALSRREREGRISPATRMLIVNQFLRHAQNSYLTIDLDTPILLRARTMLVAYPLRTLDSMQLACATEAAQVLGTQIIFVSADQRLLSAAVSEGFATDNPNIHP